VSFLILIIRIYMLSNFQTISYVCRKVSYYNEVFKSFTSLNCNVVPSVVEAGRPIVSLAMESIAVYLRLKFTGHFDRVLNSLSLASKAAVLPLDHRVSLWTSIYLAVIMLNNNVLMAAIYMWNIIFYICLFIHMFYMCIFYITYAQHM